MVQNLQNSGRSSLLFFSSAWVMHLVDIGFDLILIVPLLPPSCSFFFVFGCGVSFFGGFQDPSVSGCSISSCNFGALAGGDDHISFHSTILNWNWMFIFNVNNAAFWLKWSHFKIELGGEIWLDFHFKQNDPRAKKQIAIVRDLPLYYLVFSLLRLSSWTVFPQLVIKMTTNTHVQTNSIRILSYQISLSEKE